MKPIGVFYATREGQTQQIAEHVVASLRARGIEARLHNVRSAAKIDMGEYAGAILAASVHAGDHESEMVKFVKQHVGELGHIPSAFLSVTLSEAGAERGDATPEEHAAFAKDVQKMIDRFCEQTGWRPRRLQPVAGALLYTKYNILIRFVMKRIARQVGAPTDASRDYEYTDWAALDRFVEEFANEVGQERDDPADHQIISPTTPDKARGLRPNS